MDQIEDVPLANPGESVLESQFQDSAIELVSYPPHSDRGHAEEDEHSRQSEEENDENEHDDNGMESEESGGDEVGAKNMAKKSAYPFRPEAEDCAYYMKTGNCKFGSNCKFNHPLQRNNQEKVKEREESAERPTQEECKYYLRTGGCKYGKACRFIHSKPKPSVAPVSELNFLGLPIRLREIECPYYMRNGSCKFGANCKFNHPDPTVLGGGDPPSTYVNGVPSGSISSQANVTSWSSSSQFNETASYMPMMYSPSRGIPAQTPKWNGYQSHVYSRERSTHSHTTYLMNKTAPETSSYPQHQKQMLGDEFPERPGEPECNYFLKTGDCKFKSNCKYHHPKNRIPKLQPCALSDKSLPLRPDQNVCAHYSRYGICKFGPACKFDHPIQLPS